MAESVEIAEEVTEDQFLWVKVRDSIKLDSIHGQQVLYSIHSTSTDPLYPKFTFLTRRSLLDFQELRQLLESRHEVPIPALHTSSYPLESQIERRMCMFEEFLKQTLAIRELRSDPCLQLFIQSVKTIAEIRAQVEADEQQQDPLDSNREPQDQAAARGDDNNAQEAPLRQPGPDVALRGEIPGGRVQEVPLRRPGPDVALRGDILGSRVQEVPLRRPGPDGEAVAPRGEILGSRAQEIPFRRPGPDEAAVALRDQIPGGRSQDSISSGSDEELIFPIDDMD